MKIVAAIEEPAVIAKILIFLGLPTRHLPRYFPSVSRFGTIHTELRAKPESPDRVGHDTIGVEDLP